MNALRSARLGVCALLLPLLLLLDSGAAQITGEECLARFKEGQEDFILAVDESVKDGATYLSSLPLTRYRDCVASCCKDPKCNVAIMEKGSGEGLVNSCALFDCLYMQQYVCRFVSKKGYINYILDTVYDSYLYVETPPDETDRPPVANGGRDQVIQAQDSVTLNGITSKDDHEIVSYQWKLITDYSSAKIEKTNFEDQIIVHNLTPGMYEFQLTVTDNIGQSDSTTVTVRVLTPEEAENHCLVPMNIGPCRGSFPRWYYNAASQKCEQFNFGGCRGNRNNYLTEDQCSNTCNGTDNIVKTGRGLPIPGGQDEKCGAPCTADQFTCANQCCLDHTLECDSTPQCSDGSDENNCADLGRDFEDLLRIQVDKKVRCTELPDTGNCRDSLSKWYYDPLVQKCFLFNYGGCYGNENRFSTNEQCMKVCRGVTEKDVFARKEMFETQTGSETGIIAIAAVLGLAILILLCILVYCILRGRKKNVQHHRVPVNSAPVTSIEDRDRLVYNSTTKPI